MKAPLYKQSCVELSARIKKKEVSAVEVVDAFLTQIDSVDEKIGAYLHVNSEGARTAAKSVDDEIAKGNSPGRLGGVPLGLKDMIVTRGMPTTAGSKILEGWVAPYESTVAAKLQKEGAVFLGKQNQDEFGMGSSNENSGFKNTLNPWDHSRVPGGSSGGSAASVASYTSAASLGTDTGGSVRQPAAFCGVVGLKPTYGRVSRYGIVAYASSLDQVGPISRTVADAALLTEVISGRDRFDATTANISAPSLVDEVGKSVSGLRIGVPSEYFAEGLDDEIAESIKTALDELQKAGAILVDISLPHTEHAIPAYYFIAPAEASSNLARYDGIRFGNRNQEPQNNLVETYSKTRGQLFGAEVKRRIILGTFCLRSGYCDAYYSKAQKVRALIKGDFDAAFEKVDLIASPVTPSVAFKIGEKSSDPLAMYLSDIYTIGVNLAGLPAISVPCGMSFKTEKGGLPIGMQFIAKAFDEASLIRVGARIEETVGSTVLSEELS